MRLDWYQCVTQDRAEDVPRQVGRTVAKKVTGSQRIRVYNALYKAISKLRRQEFHGFKKSGLSMSEDIYTQKYSECYAEAVLNVC